jgi:hypothetical protein
MSFRVLSESATKYGADFQSLFQSEQKLLDLAKKAHR